jgi:hypothetical protein
LQSLNLNSNSFVDKLKSDKLPASGACGVDYFIVSL